MEGRLEYLGKNNKRFILYSLTEQVRGQRTVYHTTKFHKIEECRVSVKSTCHLFFRVFQNSTECLFPFYFGLFFLLCDHLQLFFLNHSL